MDGVVNAEDKEDPAEILTRMQTISQVQVYVCWINMCELDHPSSGKYPRIDEKLKR